MTTATIEDPPLSAAHVVRVVPTPSGSLATSHEAVISQSQPTKYWQLQAESDETLVFRWRRASGSSLQPAMAILTAEGTILARTQLAMPTPLGPQAPAGAQAPTALRQAEAELLRVPVTQGQRIIIQAHGRNHSVGAGQLTIEVHPDPCSGPQPVVSPYTLIDTRKYLLSVTKPDHACNLFGAGIEVVAMTRLLLEATAVTASQLVVFDTVTDEIVRQAT
jgi:hypothetical protein